MKDGDSSVAELIAWARLHLARATPGVGPGGMPPAVRTTTLAPVKGIARSLGKAEGGSTCR
ncbi:MAG TPA: hypothetical protein V6D08_15480 [Candidatus Obscuribacterales bacterium]